MHHLHSWTSKLRYLFIKTIIFTIGVLIPISSNFYFKVTSALAAPEALSGIKSICTSGGDYATITAAISDIASQGLDGPLVLELCASYTSSSNYFGK